MSHKLKMLVKNAIVLAIVLPGFTIASFGASMTVAHAIDDQNSDGNSCSTITLISGVKTTMTGGFTVTNPESAPGSLAANLYSGGSLTRAVATEAVIPPWVDPSVDANFIGSSALWVSSSATWPGGIGIDADATSKEGSPMEDQWRLFHDSFRLPINAVVKSAKIVYSADNAAAVYLNGNGTAIATTNSDSSEDVYGVTPETTNKNFGNVFTASFNPVAGLNTLDFVVRNWNMDGSSNPTGLLYKAVVSYCTSLVPEPAGELIGIVDSFDGVLAVTSIELIDISANANGTFSDGWKYIFHITAPMSEQNLAMKFSDWQKAGGGTIPTANNMRISSAQATNAGATILLTAPDTYSTSTLRMSGDLNSDMIGRQVEVTVEVSIPSGTPDGSYTTNYGLQSTP